MNKLYRFLKFQIKKITYIPLKYIIGKYLASDFYIPINETQENDIFIVGYPKSGNTWMQSLIAGVQYGIDSKYLPFSLANELVPDVHARKFYKRFSETTFFKSHHLPRKEYKRVIYLIRDGRDAMTSYYFMNKNLGKNYNLNDMFIEGKGIFPSKWHEHVELWSTNPYGAQILFIKYEDLLLNPVKELERVCDFSNLERPREILEKVVEGNSFENMKNKAKKFKRMGHKDWEGEKVTKFFRKGKLGDFKETVPQEILKSFELESGKTLLKFDYKISDF